MQIWYLLAKLRLYNNLINKLKNNQITFDLPHFAYLYCNIVKQTKNDFFRKSLIVLDLLDYCYIV